MLSKETFLICWKKVQLEEMALFFVILGGRWGSDLVVLNS